MEERGAGAVLEGAKRCVHCVSMCVNVCPCPPAMPGMPGRCRLAGAGTRGTGGRMLPTLCSAPRFTRDAQSRRARWIPAISRRLINRNNNRRGKKKLKGRFPPSHRQADPIYPAAGHRPEPMDRGLCHLLFGHTQGALKGDLITTKCPPRDRASLPKLRGNGLTELENAKPIFFFLITSRLNF